MSQQSEKSLLTYGADSGCCHFSLRLALSRRLICEDKLAEGYYTLVDEAENEIFHTAIVLLPGDMFISEDNSAYEVIGIEGQTPARFKEKVPLTVNMRLSQVE